MKNKLNFLPFLCCILLLLPMVNKGNVNMLFPGEIGNEIPKLNNPISEQYLKSNLLKTQPRLVLNADLEKLVKSKLKSDPVIQNMYKTIQLNAAEIQ